MPLEISTAITAIFLKSQCVDTMEYQNDEGEVWSVFHEFKVWSMVYICCCRAVCNGSVILDNVITGPVSIE